jgi:predicted DNA-binding transcriptional regulator AlpA
VFCFDSSKLSSARLVHGYVGAVKPHADADNRVNQREEAMYDPDFSKLPDRVVVTAAQACGILGISHDTLSRLHQRGEGPPRIKLSVRRIGYRVDGIRKWLSAREDRP